MAAARRGEPGGAATPSDRSGKSVGTNQRRGDTAPGPEGSRPLDGARPRDGRAWRCELAGPEDDPALRRLLREAPLGGSIRLSFPREPSYFAAARLGGERSATIVVRHPGTDEILAMGSRSVQEVWFDGRPALLGYLGQLRAAPGHRLRRRALVEGYGLARRLRAEDELPFDLSAIVADNTPARRLLERGLPGLPVYTPIAGLVTLVLPAGAGRLSRSVARLGSGWPGRGRRTAARLARTVARPDPEEIAAVAAYLEGRSRGHRLAPRWDVGRLCELRDGRLGRWHPLVAREGGAVVGCAAIWDQRALRQCVVSGYAGRLRRLRPWLNAALKAAGRPTLPPPGTALRMAYLSHLAADDEEVAVRLVESACRRAVDLGLDYLSVAFPASHPWLAALRRRFGGRPYTSVLYLVHDRDFNPASAGLDARNVRVEGARL